MRRFVMLENIMRLTEAEANEKIISACEEALREKYGDNIPGFIKERYEFEMVAIVSGDFATNYLMASEVAKSCSRSGYLYGLCGCASNSFVGYLIDITEINPLPPHYYCPKCKCVELVDDKEFPSGFDLNAPNMETVHCSKCGTPLVGDGQNLPLEFFCGYSGGKVPCFDFVVSPDFLKTLTKDDIAMLEEKHISFATEHIFLRLKAMETTTGKSAKSIKMGEAHSKRFSDLVRNYGLINTENAWMEDSILYREDVMLTLLE